MSKMTQKEFWKEMEKLNFWREYGYESVLNSLAILLDESADGAKVTAENTTDPKTAEIFVNYSKMRARQAQETREMLDKRGYYKE